MASKTLKDHKYTAEEDEWLRENIDRYTYPELTARFNALFGTNIKNVSDRCLKRLHLSKSVNRGNCPKGTRRCKNTLAVGTERIWNHAVWVKVADNVNDCKNRRMPTKKEDPNWQRKDVMTWTARNGPIPEGYLIIHLNMDVADCEIDNLYCLSRKINFMMVKNGWYKPDRDLTLTAIKWCELFYALRKGE